MDGDLVRITAAPHPLRIAKDVFRVPEGSTLEELLHQAQPDKVLRDYAVIFIRGDRISRQWWSRVRPRGGVHVEIRVVPRGGEGGKNPLRTILSLVVAVASFGLGPSVGAALGVGSSVGTAIVGLAGMLLLNAVAPVRSPMLNQLSNTGSSDSQTLFIEGARNQSRPFQVVSSLLGRHKMVPPYGSQPFTEVVGNVHFVHLIFVWGVGPIYIDLASLKIGETLLSAFTGVQAEHRAGYADDAPLILFPDTIIQEDLQIPMDVAGIPHDRTSGPNADELGIDITFPQGLAVVTENGTRFNQSVAIQILFRKVGDIPFLTPIFSATSFPTFWVAGNIVTFQGAKTGAHRYGMRWPVAERGQYEIRLFRVTAKTTEDFIFDSATWTALRTITDEDPIQSQVPMATTALRIQATDQLNRVVDEFNGIVTHLGNLFSLEFFTDTDYLDLGSPSELNLTGDMTFEAWIFVDDLSGTRRIISWANGSVTTFPFHLTVRTNGRLCFNSTDTGVFESTDTVSTGVWTHVAFTINGDQLRFYIDGVFDSGGAQTLPVSSRTSGDGELFISDDTSTFFDGKINQFRLWDDERTLAEIQDNRRKLLDGDEANLVGYWRAIEGTGTVIAERVNGNDATLVGSTAWVQGVLQVPFDRPQNPSTGFKHILQGKANAKPLPDSRLDLAKLLTWYDFNDTKGNEFNMVRDFGSSVWETLADSAAAGRAAPTLPDGKYSVVIEDVRPVPVSHITPRNSFDFRIEKTFVDPPDAWRIRFPNEDEDYRQDERRVFRDGFSDANATEFETLELPGVTNSDQIFRLGRFRIAQGLLQPERWSFSQDMEYLTYGRGDRVAITHDVLLVGLHFGRLKTVTADTNGDVIAIELDEIVTMDGVSNYGISIRTVDNGQINAQVVTGSGDFTTVVPSTPIPNVGGQPAVAAGEIFGFGLFGSETDDGSVISIEPDTEFKARVTLVPYRPAIFTADTETIPPFTTNLTPLPSLPVPTIILVTSDESVLGIGPGNTLLTRVLFEFNPLTDPRLNNPGIVIQGRPSVSQEPYAFLKVVDESQAMVLIEGPLDGEAWDFRLRHTADGLLPGPFAFVFNHTVVGKSTPPPGLEGLTISVFGASALLRWDRPVELDVLYGGTVRFRHSQELVGATWGESVSIGEVTFARDRQAFLPLKSGTYFARVVDVGGIPSATINFVTTIQASILEFANADSLDEAPLFGGVHTNTVSVDSILKLQGADAMDSWSLVDDIVDWDSEGGLVPSGTYEFQFGFDLTTVTRVRMTTRITAVSVLLLDTIDARTELIDTWEDFDGSTASAAPGDCLVEVRHTDDDPDQALKEGFETTGEWTGELAGSVVANTLQKQQGGQSMKLSKDATNITAILRKDYGVGTELDLTGVADISVYFFVDDSVVLSELDRVELVLSMAGFTPFRVYNTDGLNAVTVVHGWNFWPITVADFDADAGVFDEANIQFTDYRLRSTLAADTLGGAVSFDKLEDDNPADFSTWERLESAEFEARGFEFRAQLSTDDTAYNIHVTELGVDAEVVV